MELGYCFGKRKEKNLMREKKNLMRDPARSSTNSRKSTLLRGKSFLIKVTVGFPVWVGVLVFVWGKMFRSLVCKEWKRWVMQVCTLVKIIFIPRLWYDMLAKLWTTSYLIHHLVPEPTHESQCMQDGRRALELVETNLTGVSTSAPWNSFSGINFQRNQDQIHIRKKNERKHIFLDSSGRPLEALQCRLSVGNLVLVSGLLTWKWPVCQRSIPAAI